MIKISALLGVALLAAGASQAEARNHHFIPFFQLWNDDDIYAQDDYEDDYIARENVYSDDEDVIVVRRPRSRHIQQQDEAENWWLEDNARTKLEERRKLRKPARKLPEVIVEAPPKPKLKPKPKLQLASVEKGDLPAKPKLSVPATKPVSAPKTIGCSAGAAVVTGYGFADVKPKVCTGKTYAYNAARSGKNYEIKLTAASGEITDVRKLN